MALSELEGAFILYKRFIKKMGKILVIKGITKKFPGVIALENVDFDLYRGEIHCLVGENGAGKSTFIKILSGAYRPDSGEIWLFDKKYQYLTPAIAIDLGIQTAYQESVLVETLTVAENIFLGNEIVKKNGFFDHKRTLRLAEESLKSFGIDIEPSVVVENLSTAEKQIVSIVKALSRNTKILILDEPTSSLSSEEVRLLHRILKKIASSGVSVIYISHHLEEVFEIGDRITVFKDGKKINTHSESSINHDVLIKEMVGRPASLFYKREKIVISEKKKRLLEVVDFNREKIVKKVSFSVKSGEIFGIGGMVGSGRTELVRMMFGLDKRDRGKMFLDGKDITPNSPLDAIKIGISFITEDRQKSGLILIRPIKENISLAKMNITRGFFINQRKEEKIISDIVKKLRIVTPTLEQPVMYLSGGNQQKVVLAKWLFTDSNIFIFDEPTRGIDVGSKEEIYKLMVELAKQNKIIIMVSSDMPELIAMSDKVGIMREGRMIKILEREEVTEEKLLSYSIGVK